MTNINKMSDFQYLDYNGLKIFLQQLKDYILNQINNINGENLKLYGSTVDENPTITSQIEDLWEVIGDSGDSAGSLAENIAAILKQYVKDIQGENSENQIVSINVENNNGVYTISIDDAKLNQELITIKADIEANELVCAEALTDLDNRLIQAENNITALNSGKITSVSKGTGTENFVSLGVNTDSNKNVTITIDDTNLNQELSTIKSNYLLTTGKAADSDKLDGQDSSYYATKESVTALNSGKITSVSKGTGTENFVSLGVDTDNNKNVTITINDTNLNQELSTIKSNYLLTTGKAADSDKLDGQDSSYYATKESVTALNSGKITSVSKGTGTENFVSLGVNTDSNKNVTITINDTNLNQELSTIKTDIEANELVCAEALTDLDSRLIQAENNITALNSGKITSVSKGTGTENFVSLGVNTDSNKNVTITIDDTNLNQKISTIESNYLLTTGKAADSDKLDGQDSSYYATKENIDVINNYTINSKKISGSPTLTGNDITLGVSVGDNDNYPTAQTISVSIQKLRNTIAGLGQVMELKGVLTSLPSTTTGYGNGDVIIVGSEEYVCYDSKWYLFGYTTEIEESLESLISLYNGHKHSLTAKGSIANTCNSETKSTTSSGITSSYKDGVLTITTSHNHNYNQTTSVTSNIDISVDTGEPNSKFTTE